MGKLRKQLNKAIKQNNYDLVCQLINDSTESENLNQIDRYGDTYLINAISWSSLKIVNFLLKKGADVNFVNHAGDSALSTAIDSYYISERVEKIKLLLKHQVSLKILNSALHLAASSYNSCDIVKLLIDYGLDIDLQDNIGDTPLITASLNGAGEQSIIYLLNAGADFEIANNLGINFSLGTVGYQHQQVLNFLMSKKIDLEYFLSQPLILDKQISNNFKNKFLLDFSSFSDYLEQTIIFFSLRGREQMAILPTLEEKTLFDCGGDIYTDKALLVLTYNYQNLLNSLSLNMMVINEELQKQHSLLDYAVSNIYAWIETRDCDLDNLWCPESLLQPEWILVRKLSQFMKYYLRIETKVDISCLERILYDCLHP